MSAKLFGTLAAVALCTVSVGHAASYRLCVTDHGQKNTRWDSNSVSVRINTFSFPAGAMLDVARRAIDYVNANGSVFRINDTTETGSTGGENGQNEVWMADIDPPGVATTWFYCYETRPWWNPFADWTVVADIDEVDVVIDTDPVWTTSQAKDQIGNYGGDRSHIESVLVHEAGHFTGLMHVTEEYNIMGDSWRHLHTNGSTTKSYFGEDAARGLIRLYGARSGAWEDLSVSHYRRIGDDGEYSTHAKTIMTTMGGIELPDRTVRGQDAYEVDPGDQVKVQFTLENNGKTTHSGVAYGLYVSTNDYITRSDRRLRGGTASLHPEDVYTTEFTITIPSDLTPGRDYYVGIIIDEDYGVSETSGWNNATYVPIWVKGGSTQRYNSVFYNGRRIWGEPAYADVPATADAFCRTKGKSRAVTYATNACGEDESSFYRYQNGRWELKSSGSANRCYRMLSSVTCAN